MTRRLSAGAAAKLLLLLLAISYFILRGPIRATYEFGDFRTPYVAADVWLHGQNPYDARTLAQSWLNAGNDPKHLPGAWDCPSVYPPATFILFLPFAVVPWKIAKLTWLLLHIGLIVACTATIIHECSEKITVNSTIILSACACFAPLQMGIAFGNPTISVLLLIVGAWFLYTKERLNAAGFMLGLAICLKPHLMVGPVFYWLFCRKYRLLVVAAAIVSLLLLISFVRLHSVWPTWWLDLRNNIADSTKRGHINDPSPDNKSSDLILSISVLAYRFFNNEKLREILAYGIVSILALPAIVCRPRSSQNRPNLLLMSTFIAISMLLGYHRYYDAVLLLFAVGWAIASISGVDRKIALGVLVSLCVFLLPGDRMLPVLVTHLRLASNVTESCWWRILSCYPSAAVVMCAAFLVLALARKMKRNRETVSE